MQFIRQTELPNFSARSLQRHPMERTVHLGAVQRFSVAQLIDTNANGAPVLTFELQLVQFVLDKA